jgi:HPt (histidine-containing phosphotransfer) domain-containing protein
MQGDREMCLAAGMDDYVSKPMRVEDLVGALERAAAAPRASRGVPGAGASPPSAVVLDRTILAELHADLGDDNPTLVAELIDLFLADTPLLLAKLGAAIAAGAVEAVFQCAHSLKSTSANLGAQALAALCEGLEAAARTGQLTGGAEPLRQIEAMYPQVERELRALQADLGPQDPLVELPGLAHPRRGAWITSN